MVPCCVRCAIQITELHSLGCPASSAVLGKRPAEEALNGPSAGLPEVMNRIVLSLAALLLGAAGCGGGTDGTPVAPVTAPAPTPPPTAPAPASPPMTVTGTVRATGGPAALVAGAVVRARDLGTGAVDGETTTEMDGSYAIEELRGNRYSIEVMPPSGYLSAAPVLVNRPESGDLELSADFSLLFYTLPEGTVTTLPAGRLIYKRANFFDLERKTVTFTPNGDGYTVTVGDLSWEDPGRAPGVAMSQVVGRWDEQVAVDLPFAFPFAGRTWTRVYANWTGNISFQRNERQNWMDLVGANTMRSVAAIVDSRSAAGMEAMIAALWALYGDPTISVDATPARVVITWRAVRFNTTAEGHFPLGENLFQARLYPSGVIELAYRAVPERDGIVGLFHGQSGSGRLLDTVDDAVGDVVGDVGEPMMDITSIELLDNGSTLLYRVTLAEDVPERVADGEIVYRIGLDFGNYDCSTGVSVTASGRKPWGVCGPSLGVGGYRVSGATIEIPISKTLLLGADRFRWWLDAVWWGRADHEVFWDGVTDYRTVLVDGADRDLGATGRAVNGNVFEVFHYPVVPKNMEQVTSYIYERAPANDEFAVVFTDFRIDDLVGLGAGSGPINAPVQGIGPWQADPTPGGIYGSDNLLVTANPIFVGAPLWAETGVAHGRAFRNFSRGIAWVTHELTHRWVAHMQFRNPRSGRIEDLAGDGCRCHWSVWLHMPAVHPMWPRYANEPYDGQSINGGSVWQDNGDGTFTMVNNGLWMVTTGLSALDLYAMGMIPPEEVPDTFILRPAEGTWPGGTIRATKVPVRIEDVIAAMGPRVPAADESRKEFRLGVYLLHDGTTPRPDLLQRARDVSAAVAEYFFRATGGQMMVLPNPGSAH